jgi:superfamily II DNA or RNA helicase
VNVPFLFIADEVHNLGSEAYRLHLPDNATYKLGLSATPERWFDSEGTDALQTYFGKTVFQYTLEEGLNDKVLCPYKYYPVLVPLTEDEASEYCKLTAAIARIMGEESTGGASSGTADALLLKRSRLAATATNKLPLLQQTIFPLKGSAFNLVYCGDGTVESPVDEAIVRQIEAVVYMLGRNCQMLVARYTAETEMDRRSELRQRFAAGIVQCLVAIRCLDEGVDIPETRRAFLLASSTNPRQFIQRRGRVLRRSPGKDFAEIYDFIVQPPIESLEYGSGMFNTMRSLFAKELRRVSEFARLAQNGPEALHSLLPIRKALHLLDQF